MIEFLFDEFCLLFIDFGLYVIIIDLFFYNCIIFGELNIFMFLLLYSE